MQAEYISRRWDMQETNKELRDAYFNQFPWEKSKVCIRCKRPTETLWRKVGYYRFEHPDYVLCCECLEALACEVLGLARAELTESPIYPKVVHHIDGNRQNNDPSNLVELCPECHSALHHALRRAQRGA